MRSVLFVVAAFISTMAIASEKLYDFNFKDKEMPEIVKAYSDISQKKFVFEGSFRGKATIMSPGKVSEEKAFDLLSMALASNGYAIVQPKEGQRADTLWIMPARNVQRSDVQIYTSAPPQSPERMVTLVYSPKYLSAEKINKEMRILPSKDGEMVVMADSNQLVITDFSSNVVRVHALLTELDKPAQKKVK